MYIFSGSCSHFLLLLAGFRLYVKMGFLGAEKKTYIAFIAAKQSVPDRIFVHLRCSIYTCERVHICTPEDEWWDYSQLYGLNSVCFFIRCEAKRWAKLNEPNSRVLKAVPFTLYRARVLKFFLSYFTYTKTNNFLPYFKVNLMNIRYFLRTNNWVRVFFFCFVVIKKRENNNIIIVADFSRVNSGFFREMC